MAIGAVRVAGLARIARASSTSPSTSTTSPLRARRPAFTPAQLPPATTRRHSSSTTMAASTGGDAAAWVKDDTRRMLHAVYRVGNMEASIAFYEAALGAKLLRFREVPEEKYSNAFLGFGPEASHFALELTYNYGVDEYDLGTGFGHFALATPDVAAAVERVRAAGGAVTREAGPVKGGNTVIAFVKDPTGYAWELIQRVDAPIRDPLAQVMLRVTDLDAAIAYYTQCLGLTLIRTRENEGGRYTLAFLGYGPETDACVFELTHNWDKQDAAAYPGMLGGGYAQVAISTRDVFKTAAQIKAAGGKVTREPGPVPGIGTKIMATTDPDGWKVVFVDESDFMAELK